MEEQYLQEILGRIIENQDIVFELLQNQKAIDFNSYLPHIFSFLSILIAALALIITHFQSKRTEQLPLLNKLHDELNDIIISIYGLLNDPNWEALTAEQTEYRRKFYQESVVQFHNGNRYFIISSIPTKEDRIKSKIDNAGRRKIYFNDLRKRYIKIYKAMDDATKKYGSRQPFFEYFQMTEYKNLYDAYKSMNDIE